MKKVLFTLATLFAFGLTANAQGKPAPVLKEGNPKDFRMWVPLVVLVFCIALTIIGWQNIAIVGLLGAMLVCMFGSISVKRMWETTDWNTLGVIAGGVGFAAGVKSSGAADLVANFFINMLGANSAGVFRKVILPLSLPGVLSGITMVFVPSVSTFAISRLLGGGTQMLLGDLIEQQFLGGAYNPHLGAAISLVMMVVVVLCMVVMNRFGEGEEQAVML